MVAVVVVVVVTEAAKWVSKKEPAIASGIPSTKLEIPRRDRWGWRRNMSAQSEVDVASAPSSQEERTSRGGPGGCATVVEVDASGDTGDSGSIDRSTIRNMSESGQHGMGKDSTFWCGR